MRNLLLLVSVVLSSQAFSAQDFGYFGCNPRTQCALKKTVVPGTVALLPGTNEPYHAEYTVNYNFRCAAGGVFDSNIFVSAGESRPGEAVHFLKYAGYTDESYPHPTPGAFVVRPVVVGYGPLTLTDTKPSDTFNANFRAGCDLMLDVTFAVSKGQLKIWLADVPRITSGVDLHLASAGLITAVEGFYNAYIAAPDETSGFLKEQIASLRAPGTTEAYHTEADALQRIIDGNSYANVMAPLFASRDALKVLVSEGRALQAKLEFAEKGQGAVLNEALNKAEQVIRVN